MSGDQRVLAIYTLSAIVVTVYAIRNREARYLPDLFGLALALAAPRQTYAIVCVALLAIVRHTPLARGLAGGLPDWLCLLLLPGAMSSWGEDDETMRGDPVHGAVPRTDTNAESPPDRDITRGAWLRAMACARDENGRYVFSANQIVKAIGGHRATILARVKACRGSELPPAYRADDNTTAPATYPVSKR
jgi:hypothetical protein